MTKRGTAGFFDSYAHDFDAIYGSRNTLINRLINTVFRRSMRLRFEKTITGCSLAEGTSALDIGCGPGHYCVALADAGLQTVWGIDFAPAMIELAGRKAARADVAGACRFICGDFLTYAFGRTFDFTILMGVMDYMADPEAVIGRALSLTNVRAFFSFPAAEGLLAWQRRRRYRKRCDLFMYRRREIMPLFDKFACAGIEIEKLSRDYVVTVDMK